MIFGFYSIAIVLYSKVCVWSTLPINVGISHSMFLQQQFAHFVHALIGCYVFHYILKFGIKVSELTKTRHFEELWSHVNEIIIFVTYCAYFVGLSSCWTRVHNPNITHTAFYLRQVKVSWQCHMTECIWRVGRRLLVFLQLYHHPSPRILLCKQQVPPMHWKMRQSQLQVGYHTYILWKSLMYRLVHYIIILDKALVPMRT